MNACCDQANFSRSKLEGYFDKIGQTNQVNFPRSGSEGCFWQLGLMITCLWWPGRARAVNNSPPWMQLGGMHKGSGGWLSPQTWSCIRNHYTHPCSDMEDYMMVYVFITVMIRYLNCLVWTWYDAEATVLLHTPLFTHGRLYDGLCVYYSYDTGVGN